MKILIILACIFIICTGEDPEETSRVENDQNCKIPCFPDVFRNFSHPTECTKYAECTDGAITFRNCPEGQLFIAGIQRCGLPKSSFDEACVPCYRRRPLDY